ncbi:MAG: SDR family NAD(P)-dependent oxidoreductase [Acidobacteriota bacterium]|nr:SDR family NAD(P)-dependent oxidoreductase [Acidobacteriota bacterium]
MSYRPSLLDRVLDASIYFSFDASGYRRHARHFDAEDLQVDLTGRRVLITGANSGLGKVAALSLGQLGAEVWMLCRNRERGEAALADLNTATGRDDGRLELVDLSDLGSVRDLARRLGSTPVDVLVHNAGALVHRRTLVETQNDTELELTWATHVVGPTLLTELLLPNLRAATEHNGDGARGGSRVVTVTSGGMYTERLNVGDLDWQKRRFDGVVAYAQAKRAQVVLTELWARRLADDGVTVNAMHPGWADTPGVREALPAFWRFTRKRLRSPRQGADTIVWLAAAEAAGKHSGELFFDRRVVSPYLLPGKRESEEERATLWRRVREQAGLAPTAAPRPRSSEESAGEP